MLCIITCHTSLVSGVSFSAGKEAGRSESSENVADLNFESCTCAQSRTRSLMQCYSVCFGLKAGVHMITSVANGFCRCEHSLTVVWKPNCTKACSALHFIRPNPPRPIFLVSVTTAQTSREKQTTGGLTCSGMKLSSSSFINLPYKKKRNHSIYNTI